MADTCPMAFSPNGEYLALSSADGTLKLWETSTGTLKQEYTPSSHLSATCKCISWGPLSRTTETPRKKKKKRRSGEGATSESYDLIALGTTSGTILLYSVIKGDLVSQLEGGHTDTVNCVCWQEESESIYSCSDDQHIVEWCSTTGKVKRKWKADKGSVYSIAVFSGENCLLSAGRKIKLWDLHKKEVLKTYVGHTNEVFKLLPVLMPSASHPEGTNGTSALDTIDNTYFLSAARNDKFINAWHINKSSQDKNAIASFSLPEEPVILSISQTTSRDQSLLLSAVTKNGMLLVFEHTLNGKCKKPLVPKMTIQVATECAANEVPRPMVIISSMICNDRERRLLVAHGNNIQPVFEKIVYNADEGDLILIRKDPLKSDVKTDTVVSKVKTPGTSQDVTVLAPGNMAPSKPSEATSEPSSIKQKKRRKKSTADMTIEERLSAMGMEQKAEQKGVSAPPKADTLALLLAQGLQSQDKKILNNVLQNRNDTIIRNTVKRLPVPVIVPLVQELSRRMHGHAQSGHTIVKWVKTVLVIHTSYLMTFPELVDKLGLLYQMMEHRVDMFGRLTKLQSKLDIILSQISSQGQEEEEDGIGQQPLLLYQDDSSDDDGMMDDLIPDHSESEDNWEELSDMEVQENHEDGAEDDEDDDGDMDESSESEDD